MLASRRRSAECVSDLQLDRLVAGELHDLEEHSARAHLTRCDGCALRFDEIQANAALPAPPELSPSLLAPISLRPRVPWRLAGFAAAGAAALLLLFLFPRTSTETVQPDAFELTRTKGGRPALGFYFKRGGQVIPGGPDETLRSGDVIRFTYSIPETRYLTIVSVDGVGVVSIYFPGDGKPWQAEPGNEVAVPGATLLDGTVGKENVFAFFCIDAVAPLELQKRVAARRDAPEAPDGCDLAQLTVMKAAR